MKNLPEKIYLNFGMLDPDDCDFNDLKEVTHSSERVFKHDVEYIRKDVAEAMAKEFALKERYSCLRRDIEESFAEFINSRSK
jgi:hypothetical protein